MKPLLFEIGPVPIRSYGLMIVLGFLFALWLVCSRAKKENVSREIIIDLSFYLLFSAIIGSKILHVLIFWKLYVQEIPTLLSEPKELFNFMGSGLIFFGGLLAAIPTGIIYLKKKGIYIWKIADIIVPGIPLAHAFGRIGCFFAGCCHGKICETPWAVTFSNSDSLAPQNIPLHPTQLYASALNIGLVIILLLLSPHIKKYGQLFWTYVLLYPICRFIIEMFRNDERGFLFNGFLSTSQFISILLFCSAIVAHSIIARKGKLKTEQE